MAGLNKYLGILRWSLNYNDGTRQSELKEMDEDRRKWLTEAIEANVIDPVEQMQNILKVLDIPKAEPTAENSDNQELSEDTYVEMKTEALDHLLGYVEHMDLASDFIKIGGLPLVLSFIASNYSDLRCKSAELIAAIVQNHPETQEKVLNLKCLDLLVKAWDANDCTAEEKAKLLLAISSLIRGSNIGTKSFIKDHKGVALLLQGMSSAKETKAGLKLQRKALFLLRYLLFAVPSIRIVLAKTLVESLTNFIFSEDIDTRESSLMILELILADTEARKNLDDLKTMANSLADYKGRMNLESDDNAVELADRISALCLENQAPTQNLAGGSSLTDNVFATHEKSQPMKVTKFLKSEQEGRSSNS